MVCSPQVLFKWPIVSQNSTINGHSARTHDPLQGVLRYACVHSFVFRQSFGQKQVNVPLLVVFHFCISDFPTIEQPGDLTIEQTRVVNIQNAFFGNV